MLTNEQILQRWDGLENQIKAELKANLEKSGQSVEEIRGRLTEVEQVLAARRGGGGGSGEYQTPGSTVIASNAFRGFGGSSTRGKFSIPVNTITTATGSGGALTAPDRRPDAVMLPQQRLTVRDLLSVARTSSGSIEYPLQTVRPTGAAVVTEGDTKPESNIAFVLKTVPVRTIAHWTRASKQALDDGPMLQGIIDGEMRYGLKLEEEQELLFGDDTGQHLHGIVTQSTTFNSLFSVEAQTRFDILLKAIAQAEEALLPATGIVLNNIDLQQLRSIKDGDENYIVSGGPFSGPLTSIWGIPVVGTPSMDAGDFLVGAFRDGATLYDRWDAQVLVSTENESDFIKNLCTILAEERLALAVRRPGAFISGSFDVAT